MKIFRDNNLLPENVFNLKKGELNNLALMLRDTFIHESKNLLGIFLLYDYKYDCVQVQGEAARTVFFHKTRRCLRAT